MENKTDRELLEAAAKAAGIVGEYVENLWVTTDCGRGRVTGIMVDKETCWNPLIYDGDRYRLLKQLKVQIDFEYRVVSAKKRNDFICTEVWGEHEDEAHAVLRLAARIGESK